jgi:translation initiation factor IF-2
MPVRIYDIAKKLGIESKEVLVKARELGITTAKVPSSTLDKITAEYLVEKLGGVKPPEPLPAPPAPPPVVELTSAAPTPVPAPPPVAPAAPSVPPPSPQPSHAAEPPPAPMVEKASAVVAPAPVVEAPPEPTVVPAPGVPETKPEPVAAKADEPPTISEAPARAVEPSSSETPHSAEPTASVPAPSVAPEVSVVPPVAPQVAVPAPAAAEVAAPVESPAPTPPAPVVPPKPTPPPAPRIGDKVGFVVLPTRPKPPERGVPPQKPPIPSKPQPQTGRPGAGPQQRPDQFPRRDFRDTRGAQGGQGGRFGGPQFGPRGAGQASQSGPSPAGAHGKPAAPTGEIIILKPPIIVRDLADPLKRKPFQLIADLMELGVFATVNQAIEPEAAQKLCAKYNFRFEVEKRGSKGSGVHAPVRKLALDMDDKPEDLKLRAPVVTIMGHVDHGKTTLLDVIRKSDVAAGEAGGITQHIGAYTISIPHPDRPKDLQQITFLDTPGHAAFSSMRARGAQVTDVVVLVVAANDGVMPQTLEALSHAQAAQVPIIVAVNKCDHPAANPMRVRQQLQDKGLVPDEWGGQTIYVDVSALTKHGVDKLLELLVLQSEMMELKANPNRRAKGNVIESGLEPGGPTATLLVRKGTLRVGDIVLCGHYHGRVRALINEEGKRLKEAAPSVAVRMLGLNGVPEAGLEFSVVENEKAARDVGEERAVLARELEKERRPKATLETIMTSLESDGVKVLKVVVKADTQGSVEAIVDALKKIESDKVTLDVIHGAVGGVSESDVVLASASKAVVLGFHTRIDNGVSDLAKREGVQIKLYAIIYELIDQVKEAMAGLLDPLLKEVVFGAAEVRKIFELSKGGNVAGCVIASGRLVKGKARVMRRKNLVFEGIIQSLRRFQDEVNEVRAGMECGIRLDGFNDFQPGDQIECYTLEKVAQKL